MSEHTRVGNFLALSPPMLRFYSLLNTNSKRAILKPGYRPKLNLLRRLAMQTGLSLEEVAQGLEEERKSLPLEPEPEYNPFADWDGEECDLQEF